MSETLTELICHENTYKDITCNRDFFGKNWDKFFAEKGIDYRETKSHSRAMWVAWACGILADRVNDLSKEQLKAELLDISKELIGISNFTRERDCKNKENETLSYLAYRMYGVRDNFHEHNLTNEFVCYGGVQNTHLQYDYNERQKVMELYKAMKTKKVTSIVEVHEWIKKNAK